MFLERLGLGLGLGPGPGLGCVDDYVSDVLNGVSAAGTGMVYVLVCSGLALQ